MNATGLALAGYALWMLVLLGGIALLRVYMATAGLRKANNFRPDGYDVSPFSGRLCRAHANCYESFPFIGGLMLLGLASGNAHITNPLALWLLAARIAQSGIHVASTSIPAVQVRFAFFLVQYFIAAYWAVLFVVEFSAA